METSSGNGGGGGGGGGGVISSESLKQITLSPEENNELIAIQQEIQTNLTWSTYERFLQVTIRILQVHIENNITIVNVFKMADSFKTLADFNFKVFLKCLNDYTSVMFVNDTHLCRIIVMFVDFFKRVYFLYRKHQFIASQQQINVNQLDITMRDIYTEISDNYTQFTSAKEKLERLDETLGDLTDELKNERATITMLRDEIDEIKNERNATIAELNQNMRELKKITAIEKPEKKNVSGELENYRQREERTQLMVRQEMEIARLQQENTNCVARLNEKIAQLEADYRNREFDLRERFLKEQLTTAAAAATAPAVTTQVAPIESVNVKLLENEIERYKNIIDDNNLEIKKLNNSIKTFISQNQELTNTNRSLDETNRRLTMEIDSNNLEIKKLNNSIKTYMDQNQELTNTNNSNNLKIEKLNNTIETFIDQNEKLANTNLSLNETNTRLAMEVSSIKNPPLPIKMEPQFEIPSLSTTTTATPEFGMTSSIIQDKYIQLTSAAGVAFNFLEQQLKRQSLFEIENYDKTIISDYINEIETKFDRLLKIRTFWSSISAEQEARLNNFLNPQLEGEVSYIIKFERTIAAYVDWIMSAEGKVEKIDSLERQIKESFEELDMLSRDIKPNLTESSVQKLSDENKFLLDTVKSLELKSKEQIADQVTKTIQEELSQLNDSLKNLQEIFYKHNTELTETSDWKIKIMEKYEALARLVVTESSRLKNIKI
jgi:predicted  nucleic acid-binding Zn-ribbon protein